MFNNRQFFKNELLIRLITFGPLVFIPLVVGIIMSYAYNTHQENFNTGITALKQKRIDNYNTSIKSRVDGVINLINHQNSVIVEKLHHRVKDRVESAHKIAQSIYETYKDIKSSAEIQSLIKATLRPLLWNDGESFIWILDYNGVFHLAPQYLKDLEGSSIINFQDATGLFVIKKEIEVCQNSGSGFLWDTFTKPNSDSDKQYKQLAYVKAFGHYDWYFGSSEYLDTANKISNKEILNSISNISGIDDNYIFVASMDGVALLNHSLPKTLIGKNFFKFANERDKQNVSKMIEALKEKESSFVEYSWFNPATKTNEIKYSYIRKVPNTNWFVGSGFYESHLENIISKEIEHLYTSYNIKIDRLIILSITMIIISLIISYFISQLLRNSFRNYELNVHFKEQELQEMNELLEKKVLQRTQELEKLATRDSLTGCYNRYAIMKQFDIEINRTVRSKTKFSVIMFDFDYFKLVNDTYGHDAGDYVLRETIVVMQKIIRDIDIIGRYGGEEFLILMPSTNIENALATAERLRESVESYDFKGLKNITISLGVIESIDNEPVNDMLKRVDKLLYHSKNKGRNTISS